MHRCPDLLRVVARLSGIHDHMNLQDPGREAVENCYFNRLGRGTLPGKIALCVTTLRGDYQAWVQHTLHEPLSKGLLVYGRCRDLQLWDCNRAKNAVYFWAASFDYVGYVVNVDSDRLIGPGFAAAIHEQLGHTGVNLNYVQGACGHTLLFVFGFPSGISR